MIQQHSANRPSSFPITPQLIAGLLIIVVGIIFMLDELGIAPAASYLRYWPSALIVIGVVKLLQARDGGGAFAGLMFTLAGAWLQAEELNLMHISLANVWPLGLLLFGGYLVWQGLRAGQAPPAAPQLPEGDPFGPLPPLEDVSAGWSTPAADSRAAPSGTPADDARAREQKPRGGRRGAGCSTRWSADSRRSDGDGNSRMSAVAILGAVTRGNNSQSFKGGNLVAIMGGCEIDLRNAAIEGEAIIDVFALWGGIELRVPEEWTVSSQIVPLMGGVEDKTRPPRGLSSQRLTLRGAAFMGGIEIKN